MRPIGAPDELRDALVQLSFEVIAVLSRVGARHDLSLTQLRMLGVMRDRRPRMAELADFLGLDRSTVSGLVDRATRRGLVRRAGSGGVAGAGGAAERAEEGAAGRSDGRAVHVELTTAGQRLGRDIAAEVSRELAPHIHRLTPAEQRRIVVLAARLLGPTLAAG